MSERSCAETDPTLPNPWMATDAPLMSNPRCFADSRVAIVTPRPVASWRPSDPPSSSGLPVTTAVSVWPTCMLYVSITHAMTCSLVLTSGAGTSFSGPMASMISATYRRVSASSSRRDIVERDTGVVADPPLCRSQGDVVLDAIAGEDLDLAVVHQDGTRDGDLTFGVGEDLPDARLEVEDAGRFIELLQHRTEDRSVGRHVAPRPKQASLACAVGASQPRGGITRQPGGAARRRPDAAAIS